MSIRTWKSNNLNDFRDGVAGAYPFGCVPAGGSLSAIHLETMT